MPYDNRRPFRTAWAFTNANTTFGIPRGPKGKKGTLHNYGIYNVGTATAGATTTPTISVGTVADPDAYGDEFDVGAVAQYGSKSIRSVYRPSQAGFSTYILNQGELPADTDLVVTWTAATGSGAAGTGTAYVEIWWND